jgi:hypothetical protein
VDDPCCRSRLFLREDKTAETWASTLLGCDVAIAEKAASLAIITSLLKDD